MTPEEAEAALQSVVAFAHPEHEVTEQGCKVSRCDILDRYAHKVGEQIILEGGDER